MMCCVVTLESQSCTSDGHVNIKESEKKNHKIEIVTLSGIKWH